MRKVITYIVVPVLLVLGVIVYGAIDYKFDIKSSYEGIAYIKSFRSASGQINDVSNKIGMKDPEIDFKWFLEKDKDVRIEFGYITLTFPMEEFLTEQCKKSLESIGITYKLEPKKEDKSVSKLRVYYNGKEMERWLE